jgi:uncharacterized membrane protein YesL
MLLDQEVKYCYSWNRPIESYVQKYFRMELVCFMILSYQLFIGLDVKMAEKCNSLSLVVHIVYNCFVIMYCCTLIYYLYVIVLTDKGYQK